MVNLVQLTSSFKAKMKAYDSSLETLKSVMSGESDVPLERRRVLIQNQVEAILFDLSYDYRVYVEALMDSTSYTSDRIRQFGDYLSFIKSSVSLLMQVERMM